MPMFASRSTRLPRRGNLAILIFLDILEPPDIKPSGNDHLTPTLQCLRAE